MSSHLRAPPSIGAPVLGSRTVTPTGRERSTPRCPNLPSSPEAHPPPRVSSLDVRPLVLRTGGSATEAIYGLVLALSAIALSWYYGPADAARVAISIFGTAFAFWLAHAYAYVVGAGVSRERRSIRADFLYALRENSPLIEVVIPLEVLLIPGEVGIIPDGAAIAAAAVAAALEIATAGGYAAKRQGLGFLGVALCSAMGLAFGLLVVLLKLLAFTH